MKRFFVFLFALCFSAGALKAQQDTTLPSYQDLMIMYNSLVNKVDSVRQRAIEDSLLIAKYVEQSRQAALAALPAPKKPTYWTNSLLSQLNYQQTSFTNWAAGGSSNFTVSGFIDAKAYYKKKELIFENRLQVGYGYLHNIGEGGRKSEDKIVLDSKFGYRTAKNVYFSASFNMTTQIDKGYTYSGKDTTLVSQFASPMNTSLALGIEYKPASWIGMNLAPLTGTIVVVTNPTLRTNYGNREDQKVRPQFGAKFTMNIDKEIFKNVNLTTDLELFSDYINKPKNVKVKWNTLLSFRMNKLFSANLRTELIYDDDIKIANKDGIKAARLQFKESFSVGLSYTFSKE